jgi:hypothetical protein
MHVNTTETLPVREQKRPDTLLERERKRRGLTQKELGELLGVSEQAAGRYCLGRQRPRRGKDGEDGPAERLAAWSGGKIHAGNFDQRPGAKPKISGRRRT